MSRKKRASQSMSSPTPPVTFNDSSSSIEVDASSSSNGSTETLPGLGRTLNRFIRWISQPIGQLVFVVYNWFYDTPNKHMIEFYRQICRLAAPGGCLQACGCTLHKLSSEIDSRKVDSMIISRAILDRYLWCCIKYSRRTLAIQTLDRTVESLVKFLSTENQSNKRLSTDYLQLALSLGSNFNVSPSTVLDLRRHIEHLSGVKYPEAPETVDDVQNFLQSVRNCKKRKDTKFPLARAVRLYSMLVLPTSVVLMSEIRSIDDSLQKNPRSLTCLACAMKRALHVWKVASSHHLRMLVVQRLMIIIPRYLSQVINGQDESLTESAREFRDYMALVARNTLCGMVTFPNRSKPKICTSETLLHWSFNHGKLSPAHREWLNDFKSHIQEQLESPLDILLSNTKALIDLVEHAAQSPFGSIMVDDRDHVDEVRFTREDGTQFAMQHLIEHDIPTLQWLRPVRRHLRDQGVIEAYEVALQRISDRMGLSVDALQLFLDRESSAQPTGQTGVLPHPLASRPNSATGSPQLGSIAFPQPDFDAIGPSFPVPEGSGSTGLHFQTIEEEDISMPEPQHDLG